MKWLEKIKNRFIRRKRPEHTKFVPPKDAKRTEWRNFKQSQHGKGKQLA